MGWRGLENVINRIVEAVNGNDPIEGAGIRITALSNGKLIEVASSAMTGNNPGSGNAGGGQNHILVYNTTWSGVKWQNVTVVDPATCAQSTLSVLVNTGNPSDTVIVPFSTPLWGGPQ